MTQAVKMDWRTHPSFGRYEISECGDVRRGEKRLRGFIDHDGYLKYVLFDNDGNKRAIHAHRLVAETFIGPAPSPSHEVAHNNGSRVGNHYTYLRWATRAENDADTVVHGTARAGQRNGRAKITDADALDIRRIYRAIKDRQISGRISDLARAYDLHHATLIKIATGESWKHLPMPGRAA